MKFKDKLAADVFGFTRKDGNHCVCHNEPQVRENFSDDRSWREFGISGFCQKTQDEVFNDDEYDEDSDESIWH